MKCQLHHVVLLGAALVVSTNDVLAQSITVLSGGEDAQSCSFAAEMSAKISAAREDLQSCNRALDQMVLNRRDRAATFVNRGIVLSALGRFQEAMNDYLNALELQPQLPQAFVGKGNVYFMAERYDDALAAYDTALELGLQERHLVYFNRGMVFEKLDDPAAAENSYRAALELVPEWTLAQDRLTRLLEQQKPE